MSTIKLKYRAVEYKIEADTHCFILSKHHKVKGEREEYWENLGYHKDMFYLFKQLIKLNLISRLENGNSLEQLVTDTCDTLSKEVHRAINR